jgi:hypothetical protein
MPQKGESQTTKRRHPVLYLATVGTNAHGNTAFKPLKKNPN